MKSTFIVFLLGSAMAVSLVSTNSRAVTGCDLAGCTNSGSITVKGGVAYKCSANSTTQFCDCNAKAISVGYEAGNCTTTSGCTGEFGHVVATCNSVSASVCCGYDAGRGSTSLVQPQADSVSEDVSAAMGGETILDRTQNYWGYYNSTLKTQNGGVNSSCEAKIHVCFIHGYSDLTGVTDQNSCDNACNSATNTNQDECYDTDCSSRCGGWWTGSDSCS